MIVNEKIAYYRKVNCLTQSELAEKLGVSTAAVSKWEQKNSCPDISLLPQIAELFSVSIDELFGKKTVKEPVYDFVNSAPWSDDRKIRIALFCGKKLMKQSQYEIEKGFNEINFHFDSPSSINGVCKFTNK